MVEQKRRLSIDVLRAITMLLMVFVNDVAGVRDIPSWIEHTRAEEDGMGFADTIFPAFLFIVGLSLPFAIRSRINKGKSFLAIALYILLRAAALIIMGFFHVNLESYSDTAMLDRNWWAIIVTVAFFLIWLDYPKQVKKELKYALIGLGILLLASMAYIYRGGDASNPHGMQPEWWGILGIIGWAYLICALLFLVVRGNFIALVVCFAVLAAINIATHTQAMPFEIPIVGDASSPTLIMAGTLIALLYDRLFGRQNFAKGFATFLVIAVMLIAAGFIIRPYAGGISKIFATPAWVFICAGITTLAFMVVIWLVDVKNNYNKFSLIRPAGTSTLTCYLLPYLLYSIYSLIHFRYPDFLNHGVGGILRSFAVAFVIIIIGGLLEKKRIRLSV